MVIEIDRKKNAQYRKYTLIAIGLYLLSFVFMVSIGLSAMQDWGLLAVVLSTYIIIMLMFSRIFQRAVRFRRTEHHLFLDQTGLAMVDGHARVDIPWDDVEEISLKNWHLQTVERIHISTHILIRLRPHTPYNKRKYRLYDDYELPLKDVCTQIKELWTAGQDKAKLSEAS